MNVTEWIAEKNSAVRDLLVRYARMFNCLESDEFVPFLGDFVIYESQSVFDLMRGKPDVSAYFRGKIEAINRSSDKSSVRADVGVLPGYGDCALLYQSLSKVDRSMLDQPLGVMTIDVDGVGNAGKMLMITASPSPSSAIGTGLFPGLDSLPLQPNQAPLLHPINDYRQLKIELWLLDGKIGLDLRAQSVLSEILPLFPGADFSEYRCDDLSFHDSDRLRDSGLMGFPGVVVYWKGKLVLKLNGCPKADHLIAKLRSAVN